MKTLVCAVRWMAELKTSNQCNHDPQPRFSSLAVNTGLSASHSAITSHTTQQGPDGAEPAAAHQFYALKHSLPPLISPRRLASPALIELYHDGSSGRCQPMMQVEAYPSREANNARPMLVVVARHERHVTWNTHAQLPRPGGKVRNDDVSKIPARFPVPRQNSGGH
jgi:hypothetical protein